MAETGYSDGSIVVSTDLDTQGFEAGSDRMKNAVDSSTEKFGELGEALKDAVNQGTQAVQDAAPIIDKSLRDSVNQFQTSSDDIQGFINSWGEAIPEKKFESSLNEIKKMLDSVSEKFGGLSQAYSSAADGGTKEISKFETKASSVETSLDRLGTKIEEVYGSQIKTKNGELLDAKNNDDLKMIIDRFCDLKSELNSMQTEIIKVKSEMEKAKEAEIAAMEKAKAETNAAKESTRKLADENKQAWQTVKQEIKAAETETRAFDSSYNSIDKSIATLENKIFSLGPAAKKAMGGSESAVDSFEFKVANTQRSIQYLRERLDALGDTQVTTTEYDALNSGLETARAELSRYVSEKQRMLNSGANRESDEWRNTESAIAQAQAKIQEYEAQISALKANGGDTINGSDTTAYQELSDKLMQAETELANYESKVAKANNKTHILSATLKGVGKVGVTAFKLLGKGISTAVGKLKSLNKSSSGSMAAVKKLTKVFTSFGTRIKSMLKRRFISSLVSGATEGIKNLVQVSPEVNKSMSSIVTAFAKLKNSFATAFAPILTVVAPVLTTFINLLSEAFTKLGMFIAALTGATSFKKAVTVQKDYAKSLNETSKAADKANKSLAGFDQLNNTTSSENSDTTTTNPADMFEDVPIESKIANFVKRIKDAFLGGDYESIGSMVADKINGVVQKINNAIRWDNVGPKITAFIDGFTRTFNSLVDNINWSLIGDTVAQGVNTLVNTIYLLVTGIDWANLGKSLMNGLNGFIRGVNWGKLGKTIGSMFQGAISFLHSVVHNFDFISLAKGLGDAVNNAFAAIDWGMLGDTLSTGVRNAFQFISQTVKTIDWKKIGTDIATFLNNIDWPGILSDLAGMVGGLLSGALDLLIGFVEEMDWDKLGNDVWDALVGIIESIDWLDLIGKAFTLLGAAVGGATQLIATFFSNLWDGIKAGWDAVKDYFGEKVKEAGGNLWQGVLDGICEGLVSIGTWIYDNIFSPFIDGFKSAFGIHSPSTVMAEMGGFLIQGLKDGISETWEDIKSFFSDAWEDIKTTCTETWNDIKSDCSEAWDNVTSKINESCSNIKSWVSDKFTAAKDAVSEKVTFIKDKVSEGFGDAWDTVSSKVSDIKDEVSEGFSNVYSTVSTKVTDITNKLSEGFGDAYSTVSSKVSDIWSSVSSTFSGLVSDAWTWGADICTNIADGISGFAGEVWDSVEDLAGDIKDFLGFSEPDKGPLSNFHTYMPDMLQLMAEGINKNKGIALNAVSNLAQGISDEAQNTSALIPIDTDNKYTNFLDTFSDTITDAFMALVSKLEAIAGSVTFAVPAVAEGTVLPYNIKMGSYDDNGDNDSSTINISEITSRIDRVANKLDEVVDAIDNKETGITDEAVYNSVKKSARKETKSTGRNPFTD